VCRSNTETKRHALSRRRLLLDEVCPIKQCTVGMVVMNLLASSRSVCMDSQKIFTAEARIDFGCHN